MKNERLINKINERLSALGKTPRGASLEVSNNANLLRYILSGRSTHPRTDTLKLVAKALECTPEWLIEDETDGEQEPDRPATRNDARANAPGRPALGNIPIIGTAAGAIIGNGVSGFSTGEPIDYVSRPEGLATTRDVYAIYVTGGSMEPAHCEGDLRFVSPHRPAAPGATVIVHTRNWDKDPGQAYIKRLAERTETHLRLEQLSPHATIEIPLEYVTEIHRVLSTNEIFGK